MRRVKVADVMTGDVVTIRGDVPLSDAVARLADSHVSGLAVLDGAGKLIGVVTTNDVLGAEAEAGDDRARARLLSESIVADVMTPRPLTTSPEVDLREAARQMEYAEVHRLFVELDGRVVGVISRSDVNRTYASGRLD